MVDHILSRDIHIFSEKKRDSIAKNLGFPFVVLEVTPFKVEDKFEHKNLATWKRQPRNEILLVAKSTISPSTLHW